MIFGNLLVKQHLHTIKNLSVFGKQENTHFMVFNSTPRRLFLNGKFTATNHMTVFKWLKLLQIVLLKKQDNQRTNTQVNLIFRRLTSTITKLTQQAWVSPEFIFSMRQNQQLRMLKPIKTVLKFRTQNQQFLNISGQEIQAED